MGNTIKHNRLRAVPVLLVLVTLGIFSYLGFPYAKKILSDYSINYYRYRPAQPVTIRADLALSEPAEAVPVLMYHGVTKESDEANTTIKNFIAHMEMLKREGYTTITVDEFYKFMQGQQQLPPKPVVLTFDDGRKDSYYTTDDILRQLGFKATIFVATARPLEEDPFYLSWDDLRIMRDSGRWEIEAHGRRSHDKVYTSPNGKEEGRYLASRIYLADKGRLETVEEYETRVEQDYVDNINDLKANLGLEPKYLAIPLDDYGAKYESNYAGARAFNDKTVRKYFRLAFMQANDSADPLNIGLPIYNYINDDLYTLRRLEVKNVDANTLKNILESEFPSDPNIELSYADPQFYREHTLLSYGTMNIDEAGFHLSAERAGESALATFGDRHWSNYTASALMHRDAGRSMVLLLYHRDKDNYISVGLTDQGMFLRETVDGKERALAPSYLYDGPRALEAYHLFNATVRDGRVSVSIDDRPIYQNVPITGTEGAVGFKVWSDRGIGAGTLRSLVVRSLNPQQKQSATTTVAAIGQGRP